MQLKLKMLENRRNNVFASERRTNNAPSSMFRDYEVPTKVRLMFSRPKHNTKGLWNIF